MDEKNFETSAPSQDWQPVTRLGAFTPMWMRARDKDGKWIYREPTEEEIQDYLEGEAW